MSKVSLLGLRRRSSRPPGSDFDRRVVWMLGSPRSGSTWLLYLLAEHDAIVPMNEPLIGWYLGPFMGDVPGLSARDFDIDNFTVRRSHEHKAPHFFATDFEGAWMPPLATLLRVRLNAHVERFPPAVGADRALLMVKEPNGSQSADILLRAMPESRLLFLLRDGRDVVDSELASIAKGSWVTREFGVRGLEGEQRLEFITEHAMKWLWRTAVVEEAYRDHRGPKHLVRYEDLLADPLMHVREIFDWLGLGVGGEELSDFIARHAFESVPEDKRGADQFHRAASPGLWRENLTQAEQQTLSELIGPKLAELGYPA